MEPEREQKEGNGKKDLQKIMFEDSQN